jgi:hypothetical protein
MFQTAIRCRLKLYQQQVVAKPRFYEAFSARPADRPSDQRC